jgi:uncharacterized protein
MPSPASDVLKNFHVYIDARGYAGNADQVKLPKLSIKTDDYLAGGLDVPVGLDMGQEKMESTVVLSKFDPDALTLWGLRDGYMCPITVKGATESLDGSVKQVVANMRGKIRGVEMDDLKAQERSKITFTMEALYYKLTVNGRVVYEIDVLNMVRIVNGVDQLAAIRSAIQ